MSGLSPVAIAQELGERLKRARLNANITQEALGERAGVSRKRVLQAEQGKVTLEVFAALLVALDIADQLDRFLPDQPLSPIQLAKLKGKARQRASSDEDHGIGYSTAQGREDELGW